MTTRNYFSPPAPKVYLSLVSRDECGKDFTPEGHLHPHMVLDPAPTLAIMEAVMVYRDAMEDRDSLQAIIMQSLYQIALVVSSMGGSWSLHPSGVSSGWPDDVDARMAILRKLTREDYTALQAAVAKVSGLSEDEVGNSDGD